MASSNGKVVYEKTPFGKEMRKHFLFDQKWKNMNHGMKVHFLPSRSSCVNYPK